MKRLGLIVATVALALSLGGCWMVGPTGTVEGLVIDATTGAGLEGVTVSADGVFLASSETDSDGFFSLTLPSGDQILQFSADGYDFAPIDVSVTAGETVSLSAGSIMASPVFDGDGIRFVLTWGETPYDLDSHLKTPSGVHIYYANRAPSGAGAYLDVDDTTSYGPETITITSQESGTYGYYVYNFSGSPDITTSGAEVRVYDQNGFVTAFQVPTSGSGDYWNVAELNGSELTPINTITSTEPVY